MVSVVKSNYVEYVTRPMRAMWAAASEGDHETAAEHYWYLTHRTTGAACMVGDKDYEPQVGFILFRIYNQAMTQSKMR